MSFNFNDPAAVQSLLDELRSSSAWQELAAATSASGQIPTHQSAEPTNVDDSAATDTTSERPSVASLLSQLQSPPQDSLPPSSAATSKTTTTHVSEIHATNSTSPAISEDRNLQGSPNKDVHPLDFEESVPILLRLSREPAVVNEVKKIKQDQDTLERQLWEERRSIHKKYEEKVKVAKTKASLIGATLSKHEADMFINSHKKELHRFDKDRAIPAWDGLISRQQAKLQRLNIPTMQVTSDPSMLGLQRRVLQVLSSILAVT